MTKTKMVVAVGVLAAGVAGIAAAGPDRIKFPSGYLKGTLYATVDRPDTKQYRELYASPGVVESVRAGKGVPHGAVLTLVQWSVHQDAKGVPIKDSNGRFMKKDILAHTVMEKGKGWGAEYPDSLRNGEWEYAVFSPQGDLNLKANYKACFECHKPHEKMDYVTSLAKLAGKFPDAASVAKAPKGDVSIVGFLFNPAKIVAAVGKPLRFLNTDDSPHFIVVQGSGQKSEVILRGQSTSMTFDKAGAFNYICGLHPSMKGTIEVR
ncbi:MAG: cytochrome P460 family protein [Betaproteobacteria bacterium]